MLLAQQCSITVSSFVILFASKTLRPFAFTERCFLYLFIIHMPKEMDVADFKVLTMDEGILLLLVLSTLVANQLKT